MHPVRLPKRFQLVREIGRGGMGAVYEAIDNERGGRVAIKTLPSNDPEAIARFKREFRALHDIHHPNLITLGELFCEEGQWAFSMDIIDGVDFIEYVCGQSVDPALDSNAIAYEPTDRFVVGDLPSGVRASGLSGPIVGATPSARYDEDRLRESLLQLAQGLDAIHCSNRVHRDIKPSNIRIREDGRVVILDFGLIAVRESDDRLTGVNVVGTPVFMAPEQASGGRIGPPSDWYSVGVLLFEALTGRFPFEGSPMQMIAAKMREQAPAPQSLVATVPEDLDAVCRRLLALDPRDRPAGRDVIRSLRKGAPSVGKIRAATSLSTESRTFVGRSDELAELESAFRSALDGQRACVVVEGESGIGKSFLVHRAGV